MLRLQQLDNARLPDDATGVTADAPLQTYRFQNAGFRLLAAGSVGPLFLLAFAPSNQFYIAWFALAPWLLAAGTARSWKSAAGLGYLGGLSFFAVNFWWLWHATAVGTAALLIYLSAWWAVAAVVVRMVAQTLLSVSPPQAASLETQTGMSVPPTNQKPSVTLAIGNWQSAMLLLPAAWVAIEWLRSGIGNFFPWFALSQSQIPLLPICQIADVTGHWGVSFWVVMVNVLVTLAIVHRNHPRAIIKPACLLAVVTLGIVAYGSWRIHQTSAAPGPTVLVIQSNFPHARGGARTVTQEQLIDFHFSTTRSALASLQQKPQKVDLIAWSETVMPPMNPEVRAAAGAAGFLMRVHDDLLALARESGAALAFGAYAVPTVQPKGAPAREADIRNAVYLYDAARGEQPRYDKVRLVPFGEYVWFRESWPWLHDWLFRAAAYSVDYEITPGKPSQQVVFTLASGARFVAPICMEDMDSAYVAGLFRSPEGKRADFILNITNDGWFNAWQKASHLQAAAFRSIENRVWTARANNTGASGFIDSTGRAVQVLGSNAEGWAVQQVGIDRRYTVYSRFGDWFAWSCLAVSAAGVVITWRAR